MASRILPMPEASTARRGSELLDALITCLLLGCRWGRHIVIPRPLGAPSTPLPIDGSAHAGGQAEDGQHDAAGRTTGYGRLGRSSGGRVGVSHRFGPGDGVPGRGIFVWFDLKLVLITGGSKRIPELGLSGLVG